MKQIPIPNVELFSEVRRLMAEGRDGTILARGSSMLPFIRDGVDMTRAEFYDRLADWEIQFVATPKTDIDPAPKGDEIEMASQMFRKYSDLAKEYYQ